MFVFGIFTWIFVLKTATAFPQGVFIGKDGSVGASWGGYSASAGLGGLLGGAGTRGGLHAQAAAPGHFASAGLGGSVADGAGGAGTRGGLHAQAGAPEHFANAGLEGSVSGGSGTQGGLYSAAGHQKSVLVAQPVASVAPVAVAQPSPVYGLSSSQASSSASASSFKGGSTSVVQKRPQSSFFDDIFNIPISTLGAVNQYLNNRNKGVVAVRHPQAVQGSASFSASSSSSSASSASASSSSASSASAGIDNNIYHGYQKNPNYNDIFNIPISVLGAVNKFLNGK